MEMDYRLSPPELSKSCLRQFLYEMTDEQLTRYRQDIWLLWCDAQKAVEQETGQTVYALTAQRIAERLREDRSSMEVVKAVVLQIPDDYGRAQLIRCLKAHFPNETWPEQGPMLKQQHISVYQHLIWDAYGKVEEHHQELVTKIEAGDANHIDRLDELLLRAELEAANQNWSDPVGKRMRDQMIEGMVWVLSKLLHPTSTTPKGRATIPMKPHEANAVKSGMWLHNEASAQPVPELGGLLDHVSFD